MSAHDEWLKLPGLFHRHEFEQVIRPARPGEQGDDWFVEEAGKDDRGAVLFAVYHRPHAAKETEK
ncbi:MAG: hypothetical protein KDC14_03060 [Planctomycetes bacterium]|nr:hypothetical protein [Planctomycetota bacterium]